MIWTRIPILPPPTLVPPHVASALPEDTLRRVTARLEQDGVWGFTGLRGLPPSPSLLPQSLGALSEWEVTMDKLTISPRGMAEEEEAVQMAGDEVLKFVRKRWKEDEWETAWFVNPPVSFALRPIEQTYLIAFKIIAFAKRERLGSYSRFCKEETLTIDSSGQHNNIDLKL